MNLSLTRSFLNILRTGKQIIIPSVHSNTYYHRDIELSVLRAYDIYNRNPQKSENKYSFKTMPSMYSNLYNSREATEYFLKK